MKGPRRPFHLFARDGNQVCRGICQRTIVLSMSLKSIWEKTSFCFNITPNKKEGLKLLYWTTLLFFYSRFFRRSLQTNKHVKNLHIITRQGKTEIKIRLQDIAIFYEIFFSKIYSLSKKNIPKGVVLDIGAHIGLASLFFWDRYFPNSKFYCIEPSLENAALLEFNTRMIDRKIVRKGISNHNGFAYLDTDGFGHNHALSKAHSHGEKNCNMHPWGLY